LKGVVIHCVYFFHWKIEARLCNTDGDGAWYERKHAKKKFPGTSPAARRFIG